MLGCTSFICAAVFGTGILSVTVGRLFHPKYIIGYVEREWCLSVVVGIAIGLLTYSQLKWKPAVWVWVVPALWFAFGAIILSRSLSSQSVIGSTGGFWYKISGSSCVNGLTDLGCRMFFLCMLPLVRSVAYSLGTLAGSRLFSPRSNLDAKSGFVVG